MSAVPKVTILAAPVSIIAAAHLLPLEGAFLVAFVAFWMFVGAFLEMNEP